MGYTRALQTALDACDALAETIDVDNGPQLKKLVDAAVGTKFSHRCAVCLVVVVAIKQQFRSQCGVAAAAKVLCRNVIGVTS